MFTWDGRKGWQAVDTLRHLSQSAKYFGITWVAGKQRENAQVAKGGNIVG